MAAGSARERIGVRRSRHGRPRCEGQPHHEGKCVMSDMLNGCFADTEYFEITAKSGHAYGVWVTTPPGYEDSSDTLPLIYVMDGNFAVGLTAPLIVAQV